MAEIVTHFGGVFMRRMGDDLDETEMSQRVYFIGLPGKETWRDDLVS